MNEQDDSIEPVPLGGFTPIRPCWHMRTMVSSMADGTLTGVVHRYTVWHLSQCTHCTEALAGLERLRVGLHDLHSHEESTLSEDRRGLVESAWQKAGNERV